MEEIWKQINWNKNYVISSHGRIWSCYYNKYLKPYTNKWGYKKIGLKKDNNHKNYYMHRLVAEVFISNPENKPYINHIDENKQNNTIQNLEWCTHQYNSTYGLCKKNMMETRTKNKTKTARKVILQFDLNGNLIREWGSLFEASLNGFNLSGLCLCCKGKRKQYKGFVWRYKNLGEDN